MESFAWVFCGDKGRFPSGVFGSRADAEGWIARGRLTGTLTAYPIGFGVYDWAISNGFFVARREDQKSPSFVQNFTCASLEHYHYEEGRQE